MAHNSTLLIAASQKTNLTAESNKVKSNSHLLVYILSGCLLLLFQVGLVLFSLSLLPLGKDPLPLSLIMAFVIYFILSCYVGVEASESAKKNSSRMALMALFGLVMPSLCLVVLGYLMRSR